MSTRIVYAALNGMSYQDAKIGNCAGTAAGTAPVISLASGLNDPRLNSFLNPAGLPKVELCNRNGDPGTVGAGTHWILNAFPVAPPLPAVQASLGAIANPYATVVFNGFLYFIEFDSPSIQCVNRNDYSIIKFGGEPAYTFDNAGYQNCGVDLEAVGDRLYALFSSGSGFGGPWTSSTLTRLEADEDEPGLLIPDGQVHVGKNAVSMALVRYTPNGDVVEHTYLLIACIGGVQNAGSGNGGESVISVVEILPNFQFVANPIVGDYASGGVSLDFKSIAATPTAANEADVFIMAASYDSSWQSNWTVRKTTASLIIEKAIAIKNSQGDPTPVPPITIGAPGFTQLDNSDGTPGYFWMTAFEPDGAGMAGSLIVGRGSTSGDQLRIFPVDAAGAVGSPPVDIPSTALYGSAGCVLNTLTLVPPATVVRAVKTHRAHLPHPVARGVKSMAEFVAELNKGGK